MQKPRESVYKRYIPAVTPQHEVPALAYWFVFSGGKLLMGSESGQLILPQAASPDELGVIPVRTQYLGLFENTPCYSVELTPEAVAPEGMEFCELRGLYGAIPEDLFHLAGRAVQVIAWDQTHQYCSRCGTPTEEVADERAKRCPACGLISYPRISPAVITAIIKDNRLLLAHAKHFRNHMFGLIAGFVEPGETLEDCVRRETLEEIGINITNIRYFGSQQWPFPNSLMIGFIADYESGEIQVDGEEIVEAEWFEAGHLPVIPEPVSIARKMIDWYVEEYRVKDQVPHSCS